MPSCSSRRATKLKSLSRYCTQYTQGRYERNSLNSKFATGWSSKTFLTMSGTVMSWKMRQSVVRVRNHNHGRTVIW